MKDIDALSRHVPNLCKVAPSTQLYHMEDVQRAGGIMAILGELDRAGLLHRDGAHRPRRNAGRGVDRWDIVRPTSGTRRDCATRRSGRRPHAAGFRPGTRWRSLDRDRRSGCIRDRGTPIRRTAAWRFCTATWPRMAASSRPPGWTKAAWYSRGRRGVMESQEDAVAAILGGRIQAGDVVLIGYEGPRGPGMQEMRLQPNGYLKSKGLGKVCALVTDGRFSGGTSGLSICQHLPRKRPKGVRLPWWRRA